MLVLIALMAASFGAAPAHAQFQTVGVFDYDTTAAAGLTLFAPMASNTTYLVDMWGRLVQSWTSDYQPGLSVYLLDNGHLLRTAKVTIGVGGGTGGRIEEFAWDGSLVWSFDYSTTEYVQHHDIEPLPNGNVLILARETRTYAEVLAAGRDPSLLSTQGLQPERIVEVEPTGPTTGTIVWEWHLWDHLVQDYDPAKPNFGVISEHPTLVDLNYVTSPITLVDWIHGNSVDYNAELDQIVISAHNFNEIWIIDHSTTTAEAASHTGGNSTMGGDIIYRWGNPQAYGAGDAGDQQLFGQHDARWIPDGMNGAGDILIFNNGPGRTPYQYSSVEEIVPPLEPNGFYALPPPGVPFDPVAAVWSYTADPPTDWYASNISGAHRLPNGNTLICSGPQGTFFEVTPVGETIWRYVNPVDNSGIVPQGVHPGNTNNVFRCTRYPFDYPGFAGHDLTPGSTLETNPITIAGTAHAPEFPTPNDSVVVTATITSASTITVADLYLDYGSGFLNQPMYDDGGHHDGAPGDGLYGTVIPPASVPFVQYYIHAEDDGGRDVNDPWYPLDVVYWYSVSFHASPVVINEVLANNQGCCPDDHGDFDGFIELYNSGASDIDLAGKYVTNDLADSVKFMLGDTTIAAHGHLVLWADNETGEGITHLNFQLNPSGGEVGLFESDANGRILADSVSYPAAPSNTSYGRTVDGGAGWTSFGAPTPGSANAACDCPHQSDAEPDGFVTSLDLASCIDLLFAGAENLQDTTCPSPRFDFDCDGFSTSLDLSNLIDHLFAGQGGPCNPCPP